MGSGCNWCIYIANTSWSLTHLHGFQLLLLLWLCIIYFFCLYQQNKSELNVKSRQASNHCKSVLEAAKLAYVNKTKESVTSQKLGSQDFWRITNSVFNKGKSDVPSQINSPEILSSVSYKAKLFAKNFSKNSNLMTQASLYLLLFPFLELIWNCIIFL